MSDLMKRRATTAFVLGAAAVTLAACGSSSGSSSGSNPNALKALPLKAGESPTGQQMYNGKKGGTLQVYDQEDFEHLDPGQAYFAVDYEAMYATQRPLYSYMPNNDTLASPDVASGQPVISDGGKTVTVHLKTNVFFSPPVNRAVTSADVAYAIERGANPNVANPYFGPYFGSIVGAENAKGTVIANGGPIAGITTPNPTTIVFKLTSPTASLLVGALSLPLTAAVPESFAKPMDAQKPTTYGSKFVVATGPYMFKADPKTGAFLNIGYSPGKSATLVRNPNWKAASDFRPAYLDQIDINVGGDQTVIGRQTLAGQDTVQNDTPASSIVKLAYQQYPSQIVFTPGGGDHYMALDNQHGPFKNVNVRRAVYAAVDRDAIVRVLGGTLVAAPATHFLYPGVDGYQQSGGAAGPQVPWNVDTAGNLQTAEKYMKLAGFPSGKYTGTAVIQVVGENAPTDEARSEVDVQALTELGFKVHTTFVDQATMYAKYCGVPSQNIDACPSVGWIRDFADPQTVLYVPFWGPGIVPTNNSNWGQVNDPTINAAMDKAALVVGAAARAQAWANIDKTLVNDAVAVPEDFDDQPTIEGKNVRGISQIWDIGEWDYSFTSIK
jgi:peptide/nickel transport system substrate-binding protein